MTNGEELGGFASGKDRVWSATAAKTESESVFEQYLQGQMVKWRRIPETKRPQPDYAVQHAGLSCVLEVKEFDEPNGEQAQELKRGGGGFDPCPPIRQKIHDACKQFRDYKSCPCAVVLWNSKSILRDIRPEVVMASAFGRYVGMEPDFLGSLGGDAPTYRFQGAAELRPTVHTTVSAIAILTRYQLDQIWLEGWHRLSEKKHRGEPIQPGDQWNFTQQAANEFVGDRYVYEGTLRTIVIENPYARVMFPHDLFTGPFDKRWAMEESGSFTLVFMGAELQRLKQDGVPFIYL